MKEKSTRDNSIMEAYPKTSKLPEEEFHITHLLGIEYDSAAKPVSTGSTGFANKDRLRYRNIC